MTRRATIRGGRRPVSLVFLVGLLALLVTVPATSQSTQETAPPVLLIMDSSGSMNGDDGTGRSKIQAAKQALKDVVDSTETDPGPQPRPGDSVAAGALWMGILGLFLGFAGGATAGRMRRT